jgi:hypothetical protein
MLLSNTPSFFRAFRERSTALLRATAAVTGKPTPRLPAREYVAIAGQVEDARSPPRSAATKPPPNPRVVRSGGLEPDPIVVVLFGTACRCPRILQANPHRLRVCLVADRCGDFSSLGRRPGHSAGDPLARLYHSLPDAVREIKLPPVFHRRSTAMPAGTISTHQRPSTLSVPREEFSEIIRITRPSAWRPPGSIPTIQTSNKEASHHGR